jgi:hypothetical protein
MRAPGVGKDAPQSHEERTVSAPRAAGAFLPPAASQAAPSASGRVSVKDYGAEPVEAHPGLGAALLRIGGVSVMSPRMGRDVVGRVLACGVAFGPTADRVPGRPNQCHANAALRWAHSRGQCRIATGFALGGDGVWREHSWVVQPRGALPTPSVGMIGPPWRPRSPVKPTSATCWTTRRPRTSAFSTSEGSDPWGFVTS